jgi:dipeptidyl-peptidase 4
MSRRHPHPVVVAFFLLAPSGFFQAAAAQEGAPVARPVPELTSADYQRAEAFRNSNLQERAYRVDVSPRFYRGDRFWYRVRVPGGHEFVAVDPDRGERRPAFDHSGVAAALSEAAKEAFEPLRLPFTDFEYVDGEGAIRFRASGRGWRCAVDGSGCRTVEAGVEAPPASVTSPDGRWAAFRRDHDLWVRNLETGDEVRLTTDAEERHGYAADSQGWRRTASPVLLWSPDSRRIATYRLDEREVPEIHLLETAEPRPIHHAWPYAVPGDTIVPMLERVVVDVEARTVTRLDTPPDHQRTSSCCGLTRGPYWADVAWSRDGSRLAFVSTARDYRSLALRVADPVSGAVRTVLQESDSVFVKTNLRSGGVPNWRVLHGSGEVIWFSWKDGWGHLYLHDLETGALRHRITSGPWNVVDIIRVDEARREVLFTGVGREEGRNPYFRHLYRVSLDGGAPVLLTSEDAHHDVTPTPSGAFVVDTRSRPDQAPVTVLRRARDGQVTRTLEEGDLSELEELGWRPPEIFRAKARDGTTDVWGLLFRPSHFDPARSYPVINSNYPGPQSGSVRSWGFTLNHRGDAQALAELGFVLVQIDAMGTPLRSRAFHTAYYRDMGDNGLPDQIAAMRELAGRHTWIDLDRVGMFGHSGGGFSTAAALLRHPDFFHVGVSGAGNHDNRGYTYYWGERYHGLLERDPETGADSYERQANHLLAGNLRGKLLLSYGTMDPNVHPNTTLLLIDALIRENKDFDLIVLPNRGHGYANEAYKVRRTWDYFVTHLLGVRTPREFPLGR